MRAADALLYVVLGCQREREREKRNAKRDKQRCVRVQSVRSVPISEVCSVTDCSLISVAG